MLCMASLTFDKARWYEDSDGFWLAVRTKERAAAEQFCAGMADKPHTAELKEQRKKRSLDANAYLWTLLDKLADVLRTTKDALYLNAVQDVGPYKDFTLTEDEAKTFRVAWERLGTGWPTEIVDYDPDGERVVIRSYYGSSTYNAKQMSRLIDWVIEECKDQGIETMTPEELARLKEDWHA